MSIRIYLFVSIFLMAASLIAAQPIAIAQEKTNDPEITKPELEKVEAPKKSKKSGEETSPEVEAVIDDVEVPKVSYDLEALPFPTRRMRELLLEAAKAGDVEKLRQYIGIGDNATQLSFGGNDGDPIEFLKQESGDELGYEILAILSEVLEAGYVRLDADTENELFVWPYFFALPIDGLTAQQKVELFRIVTYGDFQDMKEFGGYIFYRVGITPTGRWTFFVAGD